MAEGYPVGFKDWQHSLSVISFVPLSQLRNKRKWQWKLERNNQRNKVIKWRDRHWWISRRVDQCVCFLFSLSLLVRFFPRHLSIEPTNQPTKKSSRRLESFQSCSSKTIGHDEVIGDSFRFNYSLKLQTRERDWEFSFLRSGRGKEILASRLRAKVNELLARFQTYLASHARSLWFFLLILSALSIWKSSLKYEQVHFLSIVILFFKYYWTVCVLFLFGQVANRCAQPAVLNVSTPLKWSPRQPHRIRQVWKSFLAHTHISKRKNEILKKISWSNIKTSDKTKSRFRLNEVNDQSN